MTENRIKHYFELAENASKYSDFRIKLGCVLIYKNKVLSIGWNSTKTATTQCYYNRLRGYDVEVETTHNSLHAEIACLLKARDLDIEWNKANIFVFRRKRNGSVGMARPCNACMAYIKSFGIKNIYYTTENGWAYERIDES